MEVWKNKYRTIKKDLVKFKQSHDLFRQQLSQEIENHLLENENSAEEFLELIQRL